VRINLAQLKDEKFKGVLEEKVRSACAHSVAKFKEISQAVESKLTKS